VRPRASTLRCAEGPCARCAPGIRLLRNKPALRLPSGRAAIGPSEDVVSIDAAIAMRGTFAQDSPALPAFFDALVDLLTGSPPHPAAWSVMKR